MTPELCDAFPSISNSRKGESIPTKKTTVLSLITAAAVITTSVGTFAAFDILSANNTGNGAVLDFGTPVTVAMNMDAGTANDRTLGQAPSVTTTATVTVQNDELEPLGEKITLAFDLAGTDGTPLVETTDYTLDVQANSAYVDGSSTITSKSDNVNFEDSNVKGGEKKYDVTVTLTETGAQKIAEKNGSAEVKLEMIATLS